MTASISLKVVEPQLIAAVHRSVMPGGVGAAWGPALDQVWALLRTQPGLRTDGHNLFLYRHPVQPGAPIECDFGVEVTRDFAPSGEVRPVRTPAGEVATAVHVGAYAGLHETHAAIQAWVRANNRALGGASWEVYGDPSPDPQKTETTVYYLLR